MNTQPKQQIIDRIAADITEEEEDVYIGALREYYRRNFKNGEHHESFLLWLEGKLGMHDD